MPEINEPVQGGAQKPLEKPSAYERTKELTDRLEAGMKDLFQSDKFKEYLKSMSHFHHYSSRNIMLINMQMLGATRVASFKLWEEKFNRHVKKGEHGIRIFAPIADKTPEKKMMEKLDPETGAPLLDKDGKVIMEEMTALTSGVRFKLVPVFDASQTYGDPLPELAENLTGNVEHYNAFLSALEQVSPLPIVFEPLAEGHDGYCRYGEKIGIREGMSEIQTVCAIVHEITHARLHDKGLENADVPKYVKEVQAESISYVVCQHYGIETASNSFGYLAEYGSRDMSELKASLDTIRKEASSLITAIGDRFGQICHERGIDLAAKTPEIPAAPEKQPEPEYTVETRTENIAGVDFQINDVIPQAAVPEQSNDFRQKIANMVIAFYEKHVPDYNTNEKDSILADIREMVEKKDHHAMSVYLQRLTERMPDDGAIESAGDYYSVIINAMEKNDPALQAQRAAEIAEEERGYARYDYQQTHPGEDYDSVAESADPGEMPDPSIGVSEMNLYGYDYDGMLPLLKDRALELYDQDHAVYLLYPDNTEAMAFDRTEIESFDGIFGIESAEWQRMLDYTAQSAKNVEAAKESDLINSNTDMFGIYQLRSDEDLHYHRFASLKQLENDHIAVDRGNYELVYTAPLPPKETLDGIYQQFNTDRPKDFTGHSLSVSDVVVIQRGGEVTSHYVDNFGFAELPAFLGNERQPERFAPPEQTNTAQAPEKPAPVVEDNKTLPPLPDSKNKPVYMQSPDHAREHGELDRYRESLKLNKECAAAIDNAIKDCIVPDGHGYRLTPESVNKVMDVYGEQRVSVVLANTVRLQEWDGRYSSDTKDWARRTDTPKVRDNRDYFSAAHPAVLDGYIRLARKETEKKPSVLEDLKQGADKVRQNPPQKEPPQKNKNGLEV